MDLDIQEEEGKEDEDDDSDSEGKIEYDGIISEVKGRRKKKKINPKKLWFMISSDWLFMWKCFISNKISSSSQFS